MRVVGYAVCTVCAVCAVFAVCAVPAGNVNIHYPPPLPLPLSPIKGSVWARNPIPRIWDSKKGLHNPDSCPTEGPRGPSGSAGCLAFPAPCPWDEGANVRLNRMNERMNDRPAFLAHTYWQEGIGRVSYIPVLPPSLTSFPSPRSFPSLHARSLLPALPSPHCRHPPLHSEGSSPRSVRR